ncbi:MAG: DNA polymerase domain-containing protein [Candidatus Poseidoniales archaeon]
MTIRTLPDGTRWDQSEKGLLPQIIEELFELRDDYKQKMREASTENERNGWNTMQLATKRVMASLYGSVANAYWGWCDFDIASAITACGRQAIKFLMEESANQGYNSLYGHTDSAFVQVPFDEADALAKHLTETVQREHEASHLIVEFEAYMPYWIVGGKNLYYGICSYPDEDKGKVKSARWGKVSTLAPVSKDLENNVLTAICSGAEEEEVIELTRDVVKSIQRGDLPPNDIAITTRIQKQLSEYSDTTGGAVKAARYYNKHLSNGEEFSKGSSVNWVYVTSVPNGLPVTDVVAYMNESDLEGFTLDYKLMVDKLVKAKIKPIFNALGWDVERASGAAMPKKYW